MSLGRQYSFWGSLSPLGGLTGAGILIIASARLSWSVTVVGCLFWVYGLSTFTFGFLLSTPVNKFFPVSGRISLFTYLAAFFGSVYLFLFWLLCPFAALEVFVLLMLVPLFCAGSETVQQISDAFDKSKCESKPGLNTSPDIFNYVSNAVSQASSLSLLLVAFSIIREPLSYCSLSFPGTFQGMVTIMYFKENNFFPIGIFSQSTGALILMGYIICLYQYSKSRLFPGEYK